MKTKLISPGLYTKLWYIVLNINSSEKWMIFKGRYSKILSKSH